MNEQPNRDPDILFTMTVRHSADAGAGQVEIWHRDGTSTADFAQILLDIAESFLYEQRSRLADARIRVVTT